MTADRALRIGVVLEQAARLLAAAIDGVPT